MHPTRSAESRLVTKLVSHEAGHLADRPRPITRCLRGLAGGGVYPATPVTRRAVRSYRTFSPLPVSGTRRSIRRQPERSTSAAPSAVCFLWHFPWHRCRWPLATTVPCPVRTFLPGRAGPERPPGPLCYPRYSNRCKLFVTNHLRDPLCGHPRPIGSAGLCILR